MKLYRWDSDMMEDYGHGHIIVMAESVEQARELARIEGRKHVERYSLYNERSQLLALKSDLESEPDEYPSGVVLIDGHP